MSSSTKRTNQLIRERNMEQNLNYEKYKGYALDSFRWYNLPDGLLSIDIELALYEYGKCFFYKHPAMGLICLPCYDSNMMNIYGRYVNGNVFSRNGMINDIIDYKDGVQIWNNDLQQPTEPYIRQYSDKMTQVELAINMNLNQQKFPYLITCSKETELSMKNMMYQIALGQPNIFASEHIKEEDIKVLNTNAPYVIGQLNQYRFELEREILTYLGINNSFEKAQRMLVDEINSNNEFISRNSEIQYKYRLKACEEINKMFGLNVKVEKTTNIIKEDNIKYGAYEQGIFNALDNTNENDTFMKDLKDIIFDNNTKPNNILGNKGDF